MLQRCCGAYLARPGELLAHQLRIHRGSWLRVAYILEYVLHAGRARIRAQVNAGRRLSARDTTTGCDRVLTRIQGHSGTARCAHVPAAQVLGRPAVLPPDAAGANHASHPPMRPGLAEPSALAP
jgi:hypothetical protein